MLHVTRAHRRIIVDRVRAGMAAAKASGKRFGQPSAIPADVRSRILRMRSRGASYPKIAAALNAAAVPTVAGGKVWCASTVHKVVNADRERPEKQ
jgi:DNA invertase Pin-like site-specific DNA recombinase